MSTFYFLNKIIENNLDISTIEKLVDSTTSDTSQKTEHHVMFLYGEKIGELTIQLNDYTFLYEIVFYDMNNRVVFIIEFDYSLFKKWVASIYDASYNDILDTLESCTINNFYCEVIKHLNYDMYQLVLDLQLFKRPTKLTDNRL